jgi:formylglycine-generating enzyme required for sulfatase activity
VAWPTATDYNEAVQDLRQSVGDEELRAGQVAANPLGLPMIWSGNFADVYRIHNAESGSTWALKCFTRKVAGQADRYRHISAYLKHAQLPFMVDFKYLAQGIRVRGEWFPALKMRWVEGGIPLNQFVEQYLNLPQTLKDLLNLWVKMAGRLREAKIAHADLQHGNVLLVPRRDGSLALRLIDYDGMYVPALAGSRSAELGHPAFQHPQRSREGVYSAELDRFSNLAIYSAIHCLTVGRQKLWDRFDNGDNLLFREEDFRDPANSDVFHALWELPDADSRALVGRLVLACDKPLDHTPLLKEDANGHVFPLTSEAYRAVNSILGSTASLVPVAGVDPYNTLSSSTQVHDLLAAEELPPVLRASTPRLASEEKATLQSVLSVLVILGSIILLGFFVYRFSGPSQPEDSLAKSGQSTEATRALSRRSSDPSLGPIELREYFTNSDTGMKFRLIPAGEFRMGSSKDDPERVGDETSHHVQISKPFYMGVYEVTQEEYKEVMEENPSRFKDPSRPVEQVSWKDATAFCVKLSEMDPRFIYRLPTEAEWEYACRAGTTTRYSFGDDLDPQYVWFRDNSGGGSHAVGRMRPNAWGLYDMHGNVREWCQDRYARNYHLDPSPVDPAGPRTGSNRVARGGGWYVTPEYCRSASRARYAPIDRFFNLGFRVALVPAD